MGQAKKVAKWREANLRPRKLRSLFAIDVPNSNKGRLKNHANEANVKSELFSMDSIFFEYLPANLGHPNELANHSDNRVYLLPGHPLPIPIYCPRTQTSMFLRPTYLTLDPEFQAPHSIFGPDFQAHAANFLDLGLSLPSPCSLLT